MPREKNKENAIRASYEAKRKAKGVRMEVEALEAYFSMELETSFPSGHDYDGAVKGLIVIYNTYR